MQTAKQIPWLATAQSQNHPPQLQQSDKTNMMCNRCGHYHPPPVNGEYVDLVPNCWCFCHARSFNTLRRSILALKTKLIPPFTSPASIEQLINHLAQLQHDLIMERYERWSPSLTAASATPKYRVNLRDVPANTVINASQLVGVIRKGNLITIYVKNTVNFPNVTMN